MEFQRHTDLPLALITAALPTTPERARDPCRKPERERMSPHASASQQIYDSQTGIS